MSTIRIRTRLYHVLPGGAIAVLAALPLWEWAQQPAHYASDAGEDYSFGNALSMEDDTLLVGSKTHDGAGSSRGAAYVLVRTGASWSEQAILAADDAADGDMFGFGVAYSGDTALIGAPNDDDAGEASGSAYVFVRSGTSWSQQAKLTASDAAGGDSFGFAVALSGDTALIGARRDDTGAEDAGSVYVFQRSGTTWSQQGKIEPSEPECRGEFGVKLALDGDTALIGAPGDADGVDDKGSAWVYLRTGTVWSLQEKLIASDGDERDKFGCAVSLLGEVAVVGAEGRDEGGENSVGAAYVFGRLGTDWTQQDMLLASDASDYDYFGGSVSLTADRILVGAQRAFGLLDESAGAAYVFERWGWTWREHSKLTANDGRTYDDFGNAVALSGDVAFVGAVSQDGPATGSGCIYRFEPYVARASATFRTGGSNPASYSTTLPVLGSVLHATVDLGGTTGHSQAVLVGFAKPLTLPLGSGRLLLIDILDPQGELLGQVLESGPMATFDLVVPNRVELIGYELATQALHWGGVTPFALSNAQDLFLGS